MEFRARQVRLDADGPGPDVKGLWVVHMPLRFPTCSLNTYYLLVCSSMRRRGPVSYG